METLGEDLALLSVGRNGRIHAATQAADAGGHGGAAGGHGH